RDAGPLLSNNARGLDMMRLSRESPWRLPWLLRFFGPVTGAAWVADLGSDRFIPHSKLIGFELGARPNRYIELGLSLLNQQGGKGAPEASWGDRLRDIFLVMPAGAEISDKILSADMVLTFPNSGIELFASALSTDPDYQLSYRLAESWWDEAIWVAGLKWSGLGPDGRIDTWIEGHHAGVRPHTHHQFKDGLTVDDRVFGDPLGPLASSWQSGIAWTGTEDILQVELFREVYSGDDWENAGTPFQWVRVTDNPDEIRFRIITNWTRNHEMSDLQTSVRLGYEHVTRFDFTDVNRSNYMAQVQFTWVPN
ncbi:MAG: capsule assembly Wzi family protein, partial [Gemmatimonadetes bacterium]|nr:capsule assembly Wzi family protein [Gemmatimonadota bacterium]